jgi:tRNA(Ser,Leu) C12 N-acetylase TAN1
MALSAATAAAAIWQRESSARRRRLEQEAWAKVIVTGRNALEQRRTRRALRRAVAGSLVRSAGFTCVDIVEAPGNPLEIAERLTRECGDRIGHATAVIVEVVSEPDRVREGAVRVGLDHVGPDESFCFRLRKRGTHLLEAPTPQIEVEIGTALWKALEERDGTRPGVDLRDPDVLVIAEVLGPTTAIGLVRKAWKTQPSPQAGASAPPPPDQSEGW